MQGLFALDFLPMYPASSQSMLGPTQCMSQHDSDPSRRWGAWGTTRGKRGVGNTADPHPREIPLTHIPPCGLEVDMHINDSEWQVPFTQREHTAPFSMPIVTPLKVHPPANLFSEFGDDGPSGQSRHCRVMPGMARVDDRNPCPVHLTAPGLFAVNTPPPP